MYSHKCVRCQVPSRLEAVMDFGCRMCHTCFHHERTTLARRRDGRGPGGGRALFDFDARGRPARTIRIGRAFQRTAPGGPNGLPVADDAARLPAPACGLPTNPKMDGRRRVRGAGPRFSGDPPAVRGRGRTAVGDDSRRTDPSIDARKRRACRIRRGEKEERDRDSHGGGYRGALDH